MIFDNLKELVIPEGNVVRIEHAGRVLWEKIIYTIQTIAGVNSITIPEVANYKGGIVEITQYGKAEQDDTPTPSTPVDIVCNNGTLKMRHRSGLPLGYTLLDYVESNGTQYIDLDVSGDATFIGTAQSTTNSPTTSQVIVANSGASAGHWFGVQSPGAGSAFAKRWGLGATVTASSTIDGTTKVDFEITFTQTLQTGTINDQTLTRQSSAITHTDWIAFAGNTTSSYGFIGKVWGLKVAQNDVLVRNLIPAKNASNFVGMYDLVSGQFFTNKGTGDFVDGDPVSDPVEIYTDGTPEVLSVSGKNLLKMPTFDEVTDMSQVVNYWSFPIKLKPNTTYYLSSHYLNGYTSVGKNFYVLITADATANTDYATIAHKTVGIRDRDLTTDNSGYLYFRVNGAAPRALYEEMLANTEVQLERGSAATDYEPYREPKTASVADLFAVGDYEDTQDIINGTVTHKVGIKVLDGTEGWAYTNGAIYANIVPVGIPFDSRMGICSHLEFGTGRVIADMEDGEFIYNYVGNPSRNNGNLSIKSSVFSNLETGKAWLAEQYTQGTPVIIVYPLAEETTDSTTPQTITASGTTTISANSNYISDISLKVDYYGINE